MVAHHWGLWASLCNVLYRYKSGGQPGSTWIIPQWPQYLRHCMCIPLRRLLFVRMGTDSFRTQRRVLSQPRPFTGHGRCFDDTMALQLRKFTDHHTVRCLGANPFQVIAKITPIMLAEITYGTFLVFGCACIMMVFYAILCVPETKGVPLESIYLLFEGNIVAGATRDTIPKNARSRHLGNASNVEMEPDGKKGSMSSHIERLGSDAKSLAHGISSTSRAI
jgi:hypothetical protein